MNDHDRVGNPPGFVDGFLLVGVQRIEGIEAAPEGVVHLGGLERIENLNRLAHALAMDRTLAPARGRDGGVFALRIDDENRPRPED